MRREIWHITEGLIFAHFAVYFLTSTGQGSVELLALFPGAVAAIPRMPQVSARTTCWSVPAHLIARSSTLVTGMLQQ